MKANKKTLEAVKHFLSEEQEYWDRDGMVTEIAAETKMLHDIFTNELDMDECEIHWGDDKICNLQDFIDSYFDIFVEKIGNVLDSFIGEDINCYFEN